MTLADILNVLEESALSQAEKERLSGIVSRHIAVALRDGKRMIHAGPAMGKTVVRTPRTPSNGFYCPNLLDMVNEELDRRENA